ncbi:MAG: hypothetical protein FJX91_06860 [Bacteroidetes bacterium]|nr:hypothetical protein [Bacteroidota bacterium]
MKIRITENSLRIRLSNDDLKSLLNDDVLSLSLPLAKDEISFVLQPCDEPITPESAVSFMDGNIVIRVKKIDLHQWISSRETSLTYPITHPNNRTLTLIVEKDYLG